ncbi:MAG: hypothetical protein N2249_00135, partial [Melioribacter sp.]|nr:hypothetical protein [Melioribacter sp.]
MLPRYIKRSGSIELFINKIEIDNNQFAFSTSPPKNIWVANSETIIVKLKFTPQLAENLNGNLLIYTNKEGSSPVSILLKGTGLTKIVTNFSLLSFGKVDIKKSKTIPLTITNRSS